VVVRRPPGGLSDGEVVHSAEIAQARIAHHLATRIRARVVDGHVIGGIGVGSGTGEQDRQVANVALAALTGAKRFG